MLKVFFIDIKSSQKLLLGAKLNIFQEIFWLEIIEQGFNKKCEIALVSSNGNDILLFPVFFHNIGPISRFGSPLRGTFSPYMGHIALCNDISKEDYQEYINIIVQTLINKGADWIEISCDYENIQIYDFLTSLGFKAEDPCTIIIETSQKIGDLWVKMQGRSRNLVRKAEKFGLTVSYLKYEPHLVDTFFSMLEDTFKKSGQSPPHSKEFYRLLISKLIVSENLLFLAVEKDEKIMSMGLFLYNENEIHFISGTSNREGNKFGANNLMHWEVIKFASNKNIKHYDFGGLGINSIDKFKRSFGGIETSYKRYIWMKPWVKIIFNLFIWIRTNLLFLVLRRFNSFKIFVKSSIKR